MMNCARFTAALAVLGLCIGLHTRPASATENVTITIQTEPTTNPPNPGFAGQGHYAPSKCLVVWLEDSSNNYIRTLGRWSDARTYDLPYWLAKSAYKYDAVMGATIGTYCNPATGLPDCPPTDGHANPDVINWDLTGRNGAILPDGTYNIVMEVSDEESVLINTLNGLVRIPIVKDGTSTTTTISDGTNVNGKGFTTASVAYTVSGNRAPGVEIAADNLYPAVAVDTVTFTSTVTDDGGTPNFTWRVVSGPASVVFSNPNSATTTATFSVEGYYVIALDADDGTNTTTDTINIAANGYLLTPTDDAKVQGGSQGGVNFGSDPGFSVWDFGGDLRFAGFLKWDLSALGSATITDARMRLLVTGDNNQNLDVSIRQVSNDGWTEGGINWNTMPAPGPQLYTNNFSLGWDEFDVTSYAQAELAGNGFLSVKAEKVQNGCCGVGFSTKEGMGVPELVVIVQAAVVDTTPPTLTHSPLLFTGTVNDSTISTITIAGGGVSLGAGGTFSHTMSQAPTAGGISVNFSATDAFSNTTARMLTATAP